MDPIQAERLDYLRLLAGLYPTIPAASTEIINLSARLNLPKGTEHFISDVHGEHEAFLHVLKNGSGSIRRKIDEIFEHELGEDEKRTLATLIYYPRRKLPLALKRIEDPEAWYRQTLSRLIRICRVVSSKYTHSQVHAALPQGFAGVIEELLHEHEASGDRQDYHASIIAAIIATGRAGAFIRALAELIQHLAIARLHILGDVYDRGPGPHVIMDRLLDYHAVDVQWGNHDIVWMGAAAGGEACLANVIRICLRYSNLETLEEGYGISLMPLATFALETYPQPPGEQFTPKPTGREEYTQNELDLMARMQKAIAVMQLKLEGQIIQRRPEFGMHDRLLLDKIDLQGGTVDIGGRTYLLNDTHFPTLDPERPYELSAEESALLERLALSFANCEKLQHHARFLYSKGGMYLVYNGNLLYHGCILMDEDGSFQTISLDDSGGFDRLYHRNHPDSTTCDREGSSAAGSPGLDTQAYMDLFDRLARQAYFGTDPGVKQYGSDVMWYLWCGPRSPLYGKDKMATFERYFVDDPGTHRESKNAYYQYRDEQATAERILKAFGLDPQNAHIINGHVPVRVKKGESPVKAGGKLLVIDGGFSKAYQDKTGIAGYTLISNSYGFLLASHDPFTSVRDAIENESDLRSSTEILERNRARIRVRDTDEGREIAKKIEELKALLEAYREGLIKERVGGE